MIEAGTAIQPLMEKREGYFSITERPITSKIGEPDG